ncbi:competence transcription factor [Listeria grandensis FSL F6-0971]|uniref:Competence transcription factor n=2 Tax=Listeria grandensis TaxID=1494963 RepID=W7BDG2_9LIST|nr:competence protein ComK [Listeria grandensis]EUJ22845.1 competence transcription factor [Listeria grandensis FSL F6-0971]
MSKKMKMPVYEVNPHTMIILPLKTKSGVQSEIFELNDHRISSFTPLFLIKTSCQYFGSSYEGRKEGTRFLTGVTHKPPIMIDPSSFTYAFPTTSAGRDDCIWIFPQHISEYYDSNYNCTTILFNNKQKIKLSVSFATFNNQMARVSMLHMKFSQKMRSVESEYPYSNLLFPPISLTAESREPYTISEVREANDHFLDFSLSSDENQKKKTKDEEEK